jgi:CHAT domain-containing protein/tetratricopeptide (TPR) repeat protein
MKKLNYIIVFISIIACNLSAQSWNDVFTQADKLYEQNQLTHALSKALQATDIAKSGTDKNSKNYANSVNLVGLIYHKQGSLEKAIEYFYLEVDAKQIAYGDTSYRFARALNNLGSELVAVGKIREGRPHLLRAFDIKKITLGDKDSSFATSAHNLAVLSFNQAEYEDAERLYNIAASIRKIAPGPNSLAYALTLKNLGILYNKLGNYPLAIDNLEKAIAIYSTNSQSKDPELVNAYFALASSYKNQGEPKKAESAINNAKQIDKDNFAPGRPESIQNDFSYAMILWDDNQLDKAKELFKSVLSQTEKYLGNGHPLYASCLNSIGLLELQLGNTQEAYTYLSNALNVREQIYGPHHPDYATSVHNLAGVLKELGRFPEAEKRYFEAFDLYQEQINTNFPFMSDDEKAKFYAVLNEKFNQFNMYVMTRYQDNPDLIAKMFDYRIATKAILLDASRKVRTQILSSRNPELISLFNEWVFNKEELSKLYSMNNKELERSGKNVNVIEEKVNTIEKKLSQKSNDFSSNLNHQKMTWRDVQKSLKPNQAAIEIVRFNLFEKSWLDSVYYVFLIITTETKDQPKLVVVKNGYDLDKYYIRNYINSIKFQIEDKDSYSAFWEKADLELQGKTTLFISQDGVYNKINLSTLQKPDKSYVLEDKNIVIVPNTLVLINRQDKDIPLKTASMFCNPTYTLSEDVMTALKSQEEKYPIISKNDLKILQENIPELPGTQEEADRISGLLRDNKVKVHVYQNTDANEANLKQSASSNILHIATHGFFLQDLTPFSANAYGINQDKAVKEPLLRSGLLFAGATNTLFNKDITANKSGNGVLTAFEASNLTLDGVNLLVLSACETGLGEVRNGEGVYGLQRAFLIAGAKNLVMSLWKVNDTATQELMTSFYTYLFSGMTMRDAFRKAQLNSLSTWEKPYYWGGFILVGNN